VNRLEQFKIIKQKYESLRDQYFMTRKLHHFMQFQQAFKEYCSFIDRHNIAPSEIERFVLTDVEECKKIVKKVKEDAIPLKPSVRQIQSLSSQQKILDCLGTREGFFTLAEIHSLSLVNISQARRYLYQLHGRGLVDLSYDGCRQLWKKKESDV
jgi:hypothetical protein